MIVFFYWFCRRKKHFCFSYVKFQILKFYQGKSFEILCSLIKIALFSYKILFIVSQTYNCKVFYPWTPSIPGQTFFNPVWGPPCLCHKQRRFQNISKHGTLKNTVNIPTHLSEKKEKSHEMTHLFNYISFIENKDKKESFGIHV